MNVLQVPKQITSPPSPSTVGCVDGACNNTLPLLELQGLIHKKAVMALVDSGSTGNYLSEESVSQLGLRTH